MWDSIDSLRTIDFRHFEINTYSYPLATKPIQYIFLDTLSNVPFLVSQSFTLELTTPKLYERLILYFILLTETPVYWALLKKKLYITVNSLLYIYRQDL